MKFYADGGTRARYYARVAKIMARVNVEMVSGPITQLVCRPPARWVIERTFAWVGRCRRLSPKTEENLMARRSAICDLASIRLTPRKLAIPYDSGETDQHRTACALELDQTGALPSVRRQMIWDWRAYSRKEAWLIWVEFRRRAGDAASGGVRWLYV